MADKIIYSSDSIEVSIDGRRDNFILRRKTKQEDGKFTLGKQHYYQTLEQLFKGIKLHP